MGNRTDTAAGKPLTEIMDNNEVTSRRRLFLWGGLVLGLVVLGVALAWVYNCRDLFGDRLCYYYDAFTDKERIKELLKTVGPLAPLIFIVVQSLQVVFAPIPGEATGFLGGFLFGVPLGMLYSTIGLTLGSIMAFLLGRWLEVHFVARMVKPETLKRFDFLMEHQGALVAFFLFVFPGFPKDYLCFILGLSSMPFKLFLVLSTVGRLPGTLMLTLQGAKVYEGEYLFSAILIGLCLLLGLVLYYFREPLYTWMQRWDHGGGREK
ncbi:MAG: TVP38/TMEM64 family protein [Thermodesulfobacteriota bacterium]